MHELKVTVLKDNMPKFYYSARYAIRHFFEWIIKSFQYSIFLWGDRDWDYYFIFKLLQYKLKRVRDCIKENDIVVNSNRIAKEIDVAVKLINKIQKGSCSYFPKEYKALKKKWGKTGFRKDKTWGYLKPLSKKDEAKAHKEWVKFYKKQDKAYKADVAKLFAHIRDKIHYWWD